MNNTTYDWWLDMSEMEFYAWYENIFTDEELDIIESMITDDKLNIGTLIRNDIDTSIRDSKIRFIESNLDQNRWVFERFTACINNVNKKFFKFDLNRLETLQYTVYDVGQFYRDHMDLAFRNPNNAVRKLSFTMQLSNPEDYQGGELKFKLGPEPKIANKKRGAITFFPSYVMHEVTPVTEGIRKSIVGWVTGPRWK